MIAYFINDLHIDKWVDTQTSFTNTAQYKKLLKKWCLPADAIFIAGDVASEVNSIYSTFQVLSEMYEHIFYVYGNHEMRVTDGDAARGLDTYKKRDRIERFLETATMNYRTKKSKLSLLRGNSDRFEGIKVAGGTGYSDGVASDRSPEEVIALWNETDDHNRFNLGWTDSLEEIADYENRLLTQDGCIDSFTDVVMTHFPPMQILEMTEEQRKLGLDFGLCSFDGSDILKKIKTGAIWHSGHLHDQFKKTVEFAGKEILCLSNAVGSPEKKPTHQVPREQFLIEL